MTLAIRDRFILGLVGGISGLIAGLGFSLVVTQSGSVNIEWVPGLSIAGAMIGFAWGALAPKKVVRRVGMVAAVAFAVFVTFSGAQPAQAQTSDCSFDMFLLVEESGALTDLTTTSRIEPAIVPVDQGAIVLSITAPGVTQGVARVLVEDDTNPLINFQADRILLWHGEIEGDNLELRENVVSTGGIGGYMLEDSGLILPPWGRVEAVVSVTNLSGELAGTECSQTVWIQFAAQPFSAPVGRAGAALVAIGLIGFAGIEPVHRRLDNRRPPEPSETRPIRRIGAQSKHVDLRFEEVLSETAPGQPPDVRSVDPNSALVQGRNYQLRLDIEPGIDAERDDDHPLTVSGTSSALQIRPALGLSFLGSKISIPVPVVPKRLGRHKLTLDILHNGHLLQTEEATVSIVGSDVDGSDQEAQTTRTVLSASDFTADELERRNHRALTLVLESDMSDGSINARAYADDQLIYHVDSTTAASSVVDECYRSRQQLGSVLQLWAESGGELDHQAAVEGVRRLAVAGRYLHQALFPAGENTFGTADDVARRVRDGLTIQVNHAQSGLGRATLPWAMVYDRPLSDHGADNTMCETFPNHPVDDCPQAGDLMVFCPTGFWGYRAVIEQPESDAQQGLLEPPVSRIVPTDSGVVVGHVYPELSDSARQREVLDRITQISWVDNLRELTKTLSGERPILGVYLYTHDEHLDNRPALAIGTGHLTPLSFDGLDISWPERPIVFLNACATGAYVPEDALTFIRIFRQAGAAGVVTTECDVFDPYAGQLGSVLFSQVLSAQPIGPALLAERRRLVDGLNPLGFAYGIHGPADDQISVRHPEPDQVST